MIAATILFLWLFLSLLAHLSTKMSRPIRRFDRFGLLPVWRYFVTNSVSTEFIAVWRQEGVPAPQSIAIPATPSTARRSAIQWLWNPARVDCKALMDVMFLTAQQGDPMSKRILGEYLRNFSPAGEATAPGTWELIRKNNLDQSEEVVEILPG